MRRRWGKKELASMDNLAVELFARGDLDGARRLYEETRNACLRVLGDDHPHTLATKTNLPATVQAQRDLHGG